QGEGVPVGGDGALSAVRCPLGRGAVSRYVEGTTPLKESAPGKGKPAARKGERPAAGGGEGWRRASSCPQRGPSFSTISRYSCRGRPGWGVRFGGSGHASPSSTSVRSNRRAVRGVTPSIF